MLKFKWVLIIILLQLIFALYIGFQLSDDIQIPSHWNIKGEIDGYVGKWTGILLYPGINIIIFLLMYFFPVYSTRYKGREKQFNKIIPSLTLVIVLFLTLIHIYTLLLAKELFRSTGGHFLILIGLLFIFLGNLLPKIPSNFFAGIRTPWTLSSESVWEKTHRIGGVCFILAGIMMIVIPLISGFTVTAYIVTFILVFSLIIFTVIYSYILYKKEEIK